MNRNRTGSATARHTSTSCVYRRLVLFAVLWLSAACSSGQDLQLPTYRPSDPDMRLVSNLTELDDALAAGTRIIFVAPGNYFVDVDSMVTIRSGGTADARRYLVYYDPANPDDSTHPVHMPPEKRAVFKGIRLFGASHCILDRLTVDGGKDTNYITGVGELGRPDVRGSGIPHDNGTSGPFTPSCNNILNRMLYQNVGAGVIAINDSCHDNTIQNSVIRKTPLPDGDWVGICLMAWRGRAGSAEVVGTRIVNNEIYDVNDGIQLFHHTLITSAVPDYRGTEILNNDIYVTPGIYSDGAGNLTPTGTYCAAENAIDIKALSSSSAAKDWVRIIGNRMWGYRYLDNKLAGSNAHGTALIIHEGGGPLNDSRGYALIKDNVIMDSVNGLSVKGQHHISIVNNILYDIKRLGHDGGTHPYENSKSLCIMGHHNEAYNNLVLSGEQYSLYSPRITDLDLMNNLILDIPGLYVKGHTGLTADYNAYYNSSKRLAEPGTNDTVSPSSTVPGHTDKVIVRRRLTAPENVVIPHGEIGLNSPLRKTPPEILGARAYMGVDDKLVPLPAVVAEEPFVVQHPESDLAMAVASEGNTCVGLHTSFTVYGFPHHRPVQLSMTSHGGLPVDAKFMHRGDNKGTFTWTSPQIGVYPLVFTATDGTHTVHKSLDLVVGDYGYPPENDGPMIYPAFPPPASATIIHVSTTGTIEGVGTEADPTTLREAQTRAMAAITPSDSVYVLLRRGDNWEGASDFVLQDGLHGYKDAPVVFGAYGCGAMPKVARMVCWGSLEYLHWQDIEFTNVTLNGNSVYTIPGDYYSGTDRLRLHLKKRHRVERLRFYQCEVNTGGVLRFCNSLANAAQGNRCPSSNMWWGGGPLAGMIRDIEIACCTFRNAGKADAININAPDRGMWIHHNVFKGSKEEHVDIGGGYGHIVEHNLGIGSRTNNGMKFHSQSSLLTDSTIRYNTILYAGGWNTNPVGGRGSALVGQNTMGCTYEYNNAISRYGCCFGDRNRMPYNSNYGAFAGNVIRGNINGGCVQMGGQWSDTVKRITYRNVFQDNVYRHWPNGNNVIRYWDAGTPTSPTVGTTIDAATFFIWTDLPVTNETINQDLSTMFVDPFDPADHNTPLDLDNAGDWTRLDQVEKQHSPPAPGGGD